MPESAYSGSLRTVARTDLDYLFTTWVIADDILSANLKSPTYSARIVCVPAVNAEVLSTIVLPDSVPFPYRPSVKVTVSPSGIVPAFDVTLAVNLTAAHA
jgi:hypothetical protein